MNLNLDFHTPPEEDSHLDLNLDLNRRNDSSCSSSEGFIGGLVMPAGFDVVQDSAGVFTVSTPLNGILRAHNNIISTVTIGSGLSYDTSTGVLTSGFNSWGLLGNSGTDSSVNFIGTTDEQNLTFRINNTERMQIFDNGDGVITLNLLNDTLFGTIDESELRFVMSGSSAGGILFQDNTFFGSNAGGQDPQHPSYGMNNTGIGSGSMTNLTSGDNNTAVGTNTLHNFNSINSNTAIGSNAMYNSHATGSVAIGILVLGTDLYGPNIGIGNYALAANIYGTNNIAIGDNVMKVNTGGAYNTAVGSQALSEQIGAHYNTVMGYNAMLHNLIGSYNTAFGAAALRDNTAGIYNTAIGFLALSNNQQSFNTAIGHNSLPVNTIGEQNTGIGANSLYSNSEGIKNTAVGAGAMEGNTTGSFNSIFGHDGMFTATTGYENSGLGWLVMSHLTTGYHNVAMGVRTGRILETGHENTFIGTDAGNNALQKIDAVNSMALGYGAYTTADNQIVLGNSSITQTIFNGEANFGGSGGTSGYVLTSNGVGVTPTWQLTGAATSVPISSLTAATGANSIDNGDYNQAWNWNGFTGANGTGLYLFSGGDQMTTNGALMQLTFDGTHINSGITSTNLVLENNNSGTSSTNVGLNVSATFGDNNYAVIVPSGGGSVGIGTSTPTATLDLVGTLKYTDGNQASGYVLTSDASGNATWQAGGGGGWGTTGTVATLTGASTLAMGTNNFTFASTGDANLMKVDAVNDKINIGNPSITIGKLNVNGAVWVSGGFHTNSGLIQGDFTDAGASWYTGSGTVGLSNAAGDMEFLGVATKSFIFNQGGLDVDFRVEGDTDPNLIVANAGTDKVGIGTSNPTEKFSVGSSSDFQVTSAGKIAKYNNSAITDGQILIGHTANGTFEKATITAGAGISVTNGAGSITIASTNTESTYTPTLTNTTNIAASTAYTTHYQRIGDVVHVWGEVSIDATTALSVCEMGLSLPVAAGIGNTFELAGTAAFEDNTSVQIKGDVTNGRAVWRFIPQTGSNNRYSFHFTYKYLTP